MRFSNLLVVCISVLLEALTSEGNVVSAVTKDDYERAERFLWWNENSYVVNGSIEQHWIGSENRFWYLRKNESRGKEFVVVDAASGRTEPAFDHEKIAACLSRHVGNTFSAGALPFSTFRYIRNG